MKIGFCSDLHIDVNSHILDKDLTNRFIKYISKLLLDVLIIAGDISNSMDKTLNILSSIQEDTGTKVLFIPGNHDIWVEESYNSWNSYKMSEKHISTLINKPYHLNDSLVIVGDMGWYDYSFAPKSIPHNMIEKSKEIYWSDSKYALWEEKDEVVLNKILSKVDKQLSLLKDKDVIFVNHFVPYKEFLVTKENNFIWNLCNSFIGSSKIGQLVDKYPNIKYLHFGHTHKRFGLVDFKNTKVICNPLGYVHEWDTLNFEAELDKTITILNKCELNEC